MRVLILGGTGAMGKALIPVLAALAGLVAAYKKCSALLLKIE